MKTRGLAHATMSLILIVLPPVGKTKTSTPCKVRAWGGAGGAAPPHPHHFLKNKNVNKIKYSGTSIWRRAKGLAKYVRCNEARFWLNIS